MSASEGKYDQFIIEKVFPSAELLLKTSYPTIDEIGQDCLFVLDANTMLAPFLVGKDSLGDVAKVFRDLVEQERLFLPEQAIREYARHRASKIAEAHRHIQERLSAIPQNPKSMEISMFENVAQYKAVVESSEKVRESIKDYKAKLAKLSEEVRSWNWNDPVSKLYADIFTSQQIITHGKKQDELSADLNHRITHSIPPGFKDKGKDDKGIGDLIIWHSILALGLKANRNVVFVTNDGKTDWMVKDGEEPLFPRFELVEEFRRITNGRFFTILRFDRFLKMRGAERTTVAQFAASLASQKEHQQVDVAAQRRTAEQALASITERLRAVELLFGKQPSVLGGNPANHESPDDDYEPPDDDYEPPDEDDYDPSEDDHEPPDESDYEPPDHDDHEPPDESDYGPPEQDDHEPPDEGDYEPPDKENYGPPEVGGRSDHPRPG